MNGLDQFKSGWLPPTADDFRRALRQLFEEEAACGARFIVITGRQLHKRVGGYPGQDHRMPVCCDVMFQEMKSGDEILHKPPRGKGATLVIRYRLPR